MADRIKAAFDSIHADECLKQNTINRLLEVSERKPRRHSLPIPRLAAAFACLLVVAITGIFAFNSYYTDAAYLDLDINPSVGLVINRYGRVIGAEPYNLDGEKLLAARSLRHKSYDAVIQELVDAAGQMGYLREDGLVSLSLSAGETVNDAALLEHTQDIFMTALPEPSARADVFLVDEETREAAHSHHVSPARYLAILELQEVDATASIEGCRDHSLQELREQTAGHRHRYGAGNSGGHHN